MEIKVYDNNGKFMDSWLIQKIKDFNSLTGMAIANDGNVYINSYNENMIFVFSSKGKLLGKFDSDTNKKFKIVNGAVLVVGGKDGLIYVFASQIAVLKTINY
jgi:outer membrane protein assembly factor BamB